MTTTAWLRRLIGAATRLLHALVGEDCFAYTFFLKNLNNLVHNSFFATFVRFFFKREIQGKHPIFI